MNTSIPQNSTVLISIPPHSTLLVSAPVSKPSRGSLSVVTVFARKVGGIFASLNVNLDRKTTIVPGMSDRTIARLSRGERIEDAVRWNALAHKYGGMPIRR